MSAAQKYFQEIKTMSEEMNETGREEHWVYSHRDMKFRVSVKHWYYSSRTEPIRHKWNVYVLIQKSHPLFDEFETDDTDQDAIKKMPLHGGCTWCQFNRNKEGEIVSVEVGSDYAHLHDERFQEAATKDDAFEVFDDAKSLFDYMTTATAARAESA